MKSDAAINLKEILQRSFHFSNIIRSACELNVVVIRHTHWTHLNQHQQVFEILVLKEVLRSKRTQVSTAPISPDLLDGFEEASSFSSPSVHPLKSRTFICHFFPTVGFVHAQIKGKCHKPQKWCLRTWRPYNPLMSIDPISQKESTESLDVTRRGMLGSIRKSLFISPLSVIMEIVQIYHSDKKLNQHHSMISCICILHSSSTLEQSFYFLLRHVDKWRRMDYSPSGRVIQQLLKNGIPISNNFAFIH